MEKMNCDIIQDLIPVYVDGICSEATRQCVEGHIENCRKCRQTTELYRNHALSSEKLEQKTFDGFKSLKKRMNYQNVICFLLIGLLTISGFCTFTNKAYFTAYLTESAYFALFIICIFATFLIGMDYKDKQKPRVTVYILGAVSFLTDAYITLMLLYFIKKISIGVIPFGLDLTQCGPFLLGQFIIAFMIQLAFFIYHFICTVKYHQNCSWLLCLDITGISLAQQYASWLYYMDTLESFLTRFTRVTLLTAIIGLLGMLASIPVTKKLMGKGRN